MPACASVCLLFCRDRPVSEDSGRSDGADGRIGKGGGDRKDEGKL